MSTRYSPTETELVLPLLMRQRAQEQPDKPYLHDTFGQSLSYREAHEQSLVWASAFDRLGVRSGDPVAMMIPTSAWSFLAWQGLSWLGAIDVPINYLFIGAKLKHIIDDSQAKLLVIHADYLERLVEVSSEVAVETVVVIDADRLRHDLPFRALTLEQFLEGEVRTDFDDPVPHSVATLLYTSGTTGPAKGVKVPWPALYATGVAAFPLGHMIPDDVLYHMGPTSHIGSHSLPMVAALFGGTVFVRNVFSLSEFWNDVDRFGITCTMLVGNMAHLIMNEPAREDDASHTLSKVMMTPLHPRIADFNERYGTVTRTIYGMTEVPFPFASVDFVVDDPASCGVLRDDYPWCEVRIVDEHDYEVSVGQIGELVVRTDVPWTINSGYWNNPEATAAAWRNGWFHTGDALRQDEHGRYYFVDRIKDAIRRSGENISSFEVESEVNAHPKVLESAVVAAPGDMTEDEILVFVVLQPAATLHPAELHDFVLERAPRFMVPRYIEIIDELPKTPTLRVQKAQLRARGLGPSTWDRGPRARATGTGRSQA